MHVGEPGAVSQSVPDRYRHKVRRTAERRPDLSRMSLTSRVRHPLTAPARPQWPLTGSVRDPPRWQGIPQQLSERAPTQTVQRQPADDKLGNTVWEALVSFVVDAGKNLAILGRGNGSGIRQRFHGVPLRSLESMTLVTWADKFESWSKKKERKVNGWSAVYMTCMS